MATLEEKLAALREAWLDMPFDGVVTVGVGQWLQPLINAVSEIVDPDRTLRETDEAKRRGGIGDLRSRHAHAVEQVKIAAKANMPNAIKEWEACRDQVATLAREKYALEL